MCASMTGWQRELASINKEFTASHQDGITFCRLDDLIQTLGSIQIKQGARKRLQAMSRINSFLVFLAQYEEVFEGFPSSSPPVGYMFGSIKYIFEMTSAWDEPFDIILDAYQKIGDRAPLFLQYRELFGTAIIQNELERCYRAMLEFQNSVMKHLSRPMWGDLFSAGWRLFDCKFTKILDTFVQSRCRLDHQNTMWQQPKHQAWLQSTVNVPNEISDVSGNTSFKQNRISLESVIDKINPPKFYMDQRIALAQRKCRSGEWIFENAQFQAWRSHSNSVLYIHGIPGAGKTILASLIVERLEREEKVDPVLFFYCKHYQHDKRTLDSILRGLLAQLLLRDEVLQSWVNDKLASFDQSKLKSFEVIEELTGFALKAQRVSFVIIDGLDECRAEETEKVIAWFLSRQKTASNGDGSQIRLLCIGQRTHTLLTRLGEAESISMNNPDHQRDIEHYVTYVMRQICCKFKVGLEVVSKAISQVTDAAKGMFLYAKLVVENLLNQRDMGCVLRELKPEIFPTGLDQAYGRVLNTVIRDAPGNDGQTALKILSWITCSERPLKRREIQASFYINCKNGTSAYMDDNLIGDYKQLCSSLVELQFEEREPMTEATITLVHETLRDHMIQRTIIDFPLQHAKMAQFCLDYLLSPPFAIMIQDHEVRQCVASGYYALQGYAVKSWFYHLSLSTENSSALGEDILENLLFSLTSFLENYGTSSTIHNILQSDVKHSLVALFNGLPNDLRTRTELLDLEWRTSQIRSHIENLGSVEETTGLSHRSHIQIYGTKRFKCARIWCDEFCEGFIARKIRDEHMNRHDRPFTCLEVSCPYHHLGFETEAKLDRHILRSHPWADDNSYEFPKPSIREKSNICNASAKGDLAAVRDLLLAGHHAQQNRKPWDNTFPLFLAAKHGHIKICELLLQFGADPNSKGPLKKCALHAAVESEEEEVVRYLLGVKDLIPDQRSRDNVSPLHLAVKSGNYTITKLLLESEMFDVNASGKDRWTPGSDLTYRTPLLIAIELNHEGIIQALLRTQDIQLKHPDWQQKTALDFAVSMGNEAVLSLLSATSKLEPESASEKAEDVLYGIAAHGHEALVRALLSKFKMDIEPSLCLAFRVNNKKALDTLLSCYTVDVGNLLARAGTDKDEKTLRNLLVAHFKPLLHNAVEHDDEERVKKLLSLFDGDSKDTLLLELFEHGGKWVTLFLNGSAESLTNLLIKSAEKQLTKGLENILSSTDDYTFESMLLWFFRSKSNVMESLVAFMPKNKDEKAKALLSSVITVDFAPRLLRLVPGDAGNEKNIRALFSTDEINSQLSSSSEIHRNCIKRLKKWASDPGIYGLFLASSALWTFHNKDRETMEFLFQAACFSEFEKTFDFTAFLIQHGNAFHAFTSIISYDKPLRNLITACPLIHQMLLLSSIHSEDKAAIESLLSTSPVDAGALLDYCSTHDRPKVITKLLSCDLEVADLRPLFVRLDMELTKSTLASSEFDRGALLRVSAFWKLDRIVGNLLELDNFDPNAEGVGGENALDIAVRRGHETTARILLSSRRMDYRRHDKRVKELLGIADGS